MTDRLTRAAVVAGAAILAIGWWRWDEVAIGVERLLPLLVLLVASAPVLARAPVRVAAAVLWTAVGVVAAYRGHPRSGPPIAGSGPDIVLVTLDTFRGDRVGPLTPSLTRFAASGASFTDAEASAPLTAPSHASLLTGRAPLDHGLRGNGGSFLGDTIVPRLLAAGWHTGAFLSAKVLDRGAGLDRGFEHYDDRLGLWSRLDVSGPRERPGDATIGRAIRWMASTDGPRFLWVHLYDAHMPYAAPAPFAPSNADIAAARRDAGPPDPSNPGLQGRAEGILRYDAEIRWVDHLVGTLLDAVPPDAVVVIVGDHGEGLGEGGYAFNHGARLDRAALHVPLIVRWPARFAPGSVIAAPTSTLAVADTLLAAAGLGEDGLGRASPPLTAWTPGQQNRPSERRPTPLLSERFGGHRLVVSARDARWVDLADPAEDEAGSVPPDHAADAARLREELGSIDVPTDDERARLEALGYVQ